MYLIIFQVLLPLWSFFARAAVTNRTIDDTYGDLITGEKPVYLPSPWQNQDCEHCGIRPEPDRAFMNTYSAITLNDTFPGNPSASMEFSFQGIAVYVYFILANLVEGLNKETHTGTLSDFTLDGSYISSFHHTPTSSPDFNYSILVFSKDNLANEKHTLNISTSGVFERFWICFDYANYTFDDTLVITTQQPSPTTTPTTPGNSHTAPVGAIVGGAVGGALVLGIIITIILYLYQRRHRSSPAGNTPSTGGLEPFLLTQSTLNEMQTSRTATAHYDSASTNEEIHSTSIASTRQAEIDRQIQELTREMQVLAGVKTASTKRSLLTRPLLAPKPPHEDGASTDQIQQQMDTMRRDIEHLQRQLHSDWARGLTNDPPPNYHAL